MNTLGGKSPATKDCPPIGPLNTLRGCLLGQGTKLLGFCAALSFVAGPAFADLCGDIHALKDKSDGVELSLPVTGQTATCTQSLMLGGGKQLHCGWAFAYRAPDAAQAFDRVVSAVTQCLGSDAAVTADLDVNHPDFYDLQTFQLGGQEIDVSLKDKATLSETYVFLRITLPK